MDNVDILTEELERSLWMNGTPAYKLKICDFVPLAGLFLYINRVENHIPLSSSINDSQIRDERHKRFEKRFRILCSYNLAIGIGGLAVYNLMSELERALN